MLYSHRCTTWWMFYPVIFKGHSVTFNGKSYPGCCWALRSDDWSYLKLYGHNVVRFRYAMQRTSFSCDWKNSQWPINLYGKILSVFFTAPNDWSGLKWTLIWCRCTMWRMYSATSFKGCLVNISFRLFNPLWLQLFEINMMISLYDLVLQCEVLFSPKSFTCKSRSVTFNANVCLPTAQQIIIRACWNEYGHFMSGDIVSSALLFSNI